MSLDLSRYDTMFQLLENAEQNLVELQALDLI